MKVYLAARYSRRQELLGYAKQLKAAGHTITSRWIRGDHEMHDDLHLTAEASMARRNAMGALFAREDIEDLREAEMLIAFTEPPGKQKGRGRGGRHVEFGYALARGMTIVVIGWRENVFCCLQEVVVHENWTSFANLWLEPKAEAI